MNTHMESISRELALKPWIYYISHTHRYGPSSKALSPGVWLARGKHPQPHCSIQPSAYEPPTYKPAEESDAGLSDAGLSDAGNTHNYLTGVPAGGFPTITHVGRVSLILIQGVSSSHRTRLYIGWPVRTGLTIHFNNESHKYPSPDIITNPSTGRIHHCLYISYIYAEISRNNYNSGNS